MARTNRRREPDEVVNVNRSMKKKDRRSDRKNVKKRLQEIDVTDPEFGFEDEEEGASTREEVLEVCWFVVLTPLVPDTDDCGRKEAVIGSKP